MWRRDLDHDLNIVGRVAKFWALPTEINGWWLDVTAGQTSLSAAARDLIGRWAGRAYLPSGISHSSIHARQLHQHLSVHSHSYFEPPALCLFIPLPISCSSSPSRLKVHDRPMPASVRIEPVRPVHHFPDIASFAHNEPVFDGPKFSVQSWQLTHWLGLPCS